MPRVLSLLTYFNTEAQVVVIVTAGRGGMPSFSGRLDEQQIADVAAYVSSAAGA